MPLTATYFITVDLGIESRDDLSPLIAAFGESITVMQDTVTDGLHRLGVAIGVSGDLDTQMRAYFTLIDGLPTEARTLWDGCTKRIFDAGFQAGDRPLSIAEPVAADVIAGVARLGASMAVTIYAVREA